MPADLLSFQEKVGYMMSSMRLIPTNKVSTDNIRVNEAAQEITFRSVKGGVEGTEERVLSLRNEPQRCEMNCREVSTEMRVTFEAHCATVEQVGGHPQFWLSSGSFAKGQHTCGHFSESESCESYSCRFGRVLQLYGVLELCSQQMWRGFSHLSVRKHRL